MKKMRKRYRLGILAAVPFFAVCALLPAGMPGASAASASAQFTSSPRTAVKLADSAAAASVATRSTAPSSPQGPKTRHLRPNTVDGCINGLLAIYGDDHQTAFTVACNIAGAVPTGAPHYERLLALAQAACGGILMGVGVGPLIAAGACIDASADPVFFTEQQWCENTVGTGCLNAWSGGPWVNDYTGGPETRDINQEMFVVNENGNTDGSGPIQIVFAGNDSWGGHCIGDAQNDPNLADTSLDPCAFPAFGQSAGWGTQMTMGTSGCPSGEGWFHDNHWNGYLGPVDGAVNGSHFYLNKPSKYCFKVIYVG
jgi:hypothetical protein